MQAEMSPCTPVPFAVCRVALLLALWGAGCSPTQDEATQNEPQPDSPPNIIFILSDDQAPGSLGIEGNLDLRTPNLDRLAREGAYFSRAYVPLPQCAASRAAILTGLYPYLNRVTTNVETSLQPDAVTVAHVLKKAGYSCGLVGKWHNGNEHQPQAGFEDSWVTFPMPGRYIEPELWVEGRKETHQGFLTDLLTDHAIQFIEDRAGEKSPFFLWLAYKAPHVPYKSGSPRPEDLYRPENLTLPVSISDDLAGKPAPQRNGDMHRLFKSSTEEEIRRSLAKYYSIISCMDRNIGRIVTRLRELDIDDRTIIVFMSDNGVMFGEHQMLLKGPAFYEELIRTPLIFWGPSRIRPGNNIDSLVSTLDLFPTFCRFAGVVPPARLSGKDLTPLLRGETDALRDAVYLQYEHKEATDRTVPMRGIVTKNHKYVLYLEDGEELYDLQNDPLETKNLIGDERYRQLAEKMQRKLDVWLARTEDEHTLP